MFQENCGYIRLTNCNRTAERIKPYADGDWVVVSRDPMLVNTLYEVRHLTKTMMMTTIIIIMMISDVMNKSGFRIKFFFLKAQMQKKNKIVSNYFVSIF